MNENKDPVLILASAINNLAEAIHRHADLKMGEAEGDEEEVTSFDMSGRPVQVG